MAVQQLELPARGAGRLTELPGSVHFIGTATTILRYGGYTLMTDPNFVHKGQHIHIGYGLFTKRLTDPALTVDQVPPVDFVLVSHLHADHFDRVAMARLNRSLPLICPPAAARTLRRKGFFQATGLATWNPVRVAKPGCPPLHITAMPGRHAPRWLSPLMPAVMGTLLEFGATPTFRVYISGDTLIHEELKQIPQRVPEIHLALLHLGGARVLGLKVTMDGNDGVTALRLLKPQTAIPIHYNDYTVFNSPLEEFQKAVETAGLQDRVRYLRHGDKFRFDFSAEKGLRERAP